MDRQNDCVLTRRRLLECAAVASAATLAPPIFAEPRDLKANSEAAAGSPPVIDCHTHFYDPTRPEGVPWPGKENELLYRPTLPAHFEKVARPLGVTGTVVVEASPWLEDNPWLLDLAKENPVIVGVVGNLTPGEPAFAKHLRRFAANKLFRGIRINDKVLADRLEDRELIGDLQRLADHDLALDVNGSPALLPRVERLARKLPELRIVVNHLANPVIRAKEVDPKWRDGMTACGKRPNVFCKVSALVEGALRGVKQAPSNVPIYRPTLDVAWKAFGQNRLIYGSNWPVHRRAAPYRTVIEIVRTYFRERSETAARRFFAENAKSAYQWVQRKT